MDWIGPGNIALDVRTLAEWFFGLQIRTVPRESDVLVGTSAIGLGQYARTRLNVGLSNNGTNPVWLSFSAPTAAGLGIQISPSANIFFSWYLDNEMVMQDFFAIAATGSNSVHVVEYVIMGAP